MSSPEWHPSRLPLRLPGFDYSKNGAYFVTFITKYRRPSLAVVSAGQVQLTKEGLEVKNAWQGIPVTFPHVRLDAFVVMPDHVHAILWIIKQNISTCKPPAPITTVVGLWKSRSARQINLIRQTTGQPVWHRNYYERVVPDKDALNRIRNYIRTNPVRWRAL